MPENIVLDYPVKIYMGLEMNSVLVAKSCEFFMDEHDHQWVKFTATNGPSAGHEHMVQSVHVVVVRIDKGL